MRIITTNEVFNGWATIGCCVLNHDYLVITLQQTESHPEFNKDERPCIRFAIANLSADLEDRWSMDTFESGWKRPKIVHTERDECLIADRQGMVYYMGLGEERAFLILCQAIFSKDLKHHLSDLQNGSPTETKLCSNFGSALSISLRHLISQHTAV